MIAIYIRNKMNIEMVFIKLQRFNNHSWPKIWASNTDVNDIGESFTCVTLSNAVYDFVCECFDFIFYFENLKEIISRLELW